MKFVLGMGREQMKLFTYHWDFSAEGYNYSNNSNQKIHA